MEALLSRSVLKSKAQRPVVSVLTTLNAGTQRKDSDEITYPYVQLDFLPLYVHRDNLHVFQMFSYSAAVLTLWHQLTGDIAILVPGLNSPGR